MTALDGILRELKESEPLSQPELIAHAAELVQQARALLTALVEGEDSHTPLLRTLELVAHMSVSNSAPEEYSVAEMPSEGVNENQLDSTLNPEYVDLAEEVELPVSRALEVPDDHKFVALRESDFDHKLTVNGRRLFSALKSFGNIDEATEYARYATERPLFVAEVVKTGDEYFGSLKYSYNTEII